MNIDHLKYPIGKYIAPEIFSHELTQHWANEIDNYPALLIETANQLTPEQLETSYRPGGWSARQVIHHIADSHVNAYIRFKLALTEDNPTIKPYEEDKWAMLNDYHLDMHISLQMISSIHKRWSAVLKDMSESDFDKTFYHPEHRKNQTLKYILGMYVWHGNHHLAHIKNCVSYKKN